MHCCYMNKAEPPSTSVTRTIISDGEAIMTVLAQPLTLAQQKALRPKQITATGLFEAKVDLSPIEFQTTTVVHDFEQAVYRINGRHADNSVTIKEIFIQIPDNVRVGQEIDLAKQEFTNVKVWYSVKLPQDHYTVSAIEGTLIIRGLAAGVIKIRGTLHATTDHDVNGHAHVLDVDFDLTS